VALRKAHTKALRLIASAALLTATFWFIPITEVIEALKSVKFGYAAAAISVMMLTAYLDALALWLPLNRVSVPGSKWSVFKIKMITRFYGQFLPSELMASAVKMHRLAGPTKQWGEVAAALAFCRLVSMLVLVLLGFILWAFEMPTGPGRWAGFLLAGMGAALLTAHFAVASHTANRLAQRLFNMRGAGWLKGKFYNKVMSVAQTTVDSYRLFGSTTVPIIFLALSRHILGIVSFGLTALSLDIHLSFLTIGWIRVVIHSLLMLPISVAGFGVREGTLVVLLQEYAVSPNEAVALAFLLFTLTVLANSIGGVFEIKNLLAPRRIDNEARSNIE
jgi:glycosyltransferase 2 family protein